MKKLFTFLFVTIVLFGVSTASASTVGTEAETIVLYEDTLGEKISWDPKTRTSTWRKDMEYIYVGWGGPHRPVCLVAQYKVVLVDQKYAEFTLHIYGWASSANYDPNGPYQGQEIITLPKEGAKRVIKLQEVKNRQLELGNVLEKRIKVVAYYHR